MITKSRLMRSASTAAGAALVLGALSPLLANSSAAAAEPTLSISGSKVLDLGFDGNLTDGTGKHSPTMQAGTASYVTGIDGQALDFTGSQAVNLGTAADLQPQDLTLSYWFKPDADMGSGEQLFAWSKGTYDSDGWYLGSPSNTIPLQISLGPASSGGQPYLVQVNATRSTFFPTGQWTHVVVTYDHVSKAVTFYRNGVQQTSVVNKPIGGASTGVLGSESTTTKTLGYNGPGYNGSFLKGALDDYRLYNGVATTADVVKLTQENTPSFDPSTVAAGDLATLSVPASATTDLTLTTAGASGSAITWTSDNTSVIAINGGIGKVTQPTGADATVHLTATADYGGGTSTKTFTVTVTKQTNDGAVVDIPETDVRTTPGVQPTLPSKINVVTVGGTVVPTPVTWSSIDSSKLTDGAAVAVTGTLDGYTSTASGTVYVRQSPSSTISGVDDSSVLTEGGVRPTMPTTVIATYADGSRSSSVPVTWAAIPSAELHTEGVYPVAGTVSGWAGGATAWLIVDNSAAVTGPSISSAGTTLTYGKPATLTAILDGVDSPSGTMALKDGDTVLDTSTAGIDGTATFTLAAKSLEVGSHDLTLSYDGDDVDSPVTGTATVVVEAVHLATATLTAPAVTTAYGAASSVTVKVAGSAGTPTGQVTLSDGPTTLGVGTLSGGAATITVGAKALAVGGHILSLAYTGDAHYQPATGSVSVTVTKTATKAPATVSAKGKGKVHAKKTRAKLKITVSAPGVSPSGTVTVKVGGKKLTAKLSHGKAKVKLPTFPSTGKKKIKVKYAGDAQTPAATATVRVSVKR